MQTQSKPSASQAKTTSSEKNKVLAAHRPAENFFIADTVLRHYFERHISQDGRSYMAPILERLGELAAGEMNELSMKADKNPPELVKRNHLGEDINHIDFHPSYWRLMEIAVESEMFRVKWEPERRERFRAQRHRLGFLSGFVYALSESGQYCPLCMTDGVARLIDRYCTEEDKERLMPHISTDNPEELFTGAMFLTEKAGGSDVGANLVRASQVEGSHYVLNGEKWFCSNANADLVFALARTDDEIPGTRGLGIFLIEKTRPDGSANHMNMIRLKDKLGVRSMASAEILLENTSGTLVGGTTDGFKIMADMINLSRLYNSVAALSGGRRGLIEAYTFLDGRETFGKPALSHALVRRKLAELAGLHAAQFYLTWKAIELLDMADNGDENAANLLRLLTPMTKKWTAETSVYIIRESMELKGGMGYIEDGVMPKVFRDANVLPIWEGAGNIMLLDMLRASAKSGGLRLMMAYIAEGISGNPEPQNEAKTAALARYSQSMTEELKALEDVASQLFELSAESREATAAPFFERLTILFQMTLLIEAMDMDSKAWVWAGLRAMENRLASKPIDIETPPDETEVREMIGWELG